MLLQLRRIRRHLRRCATTMDEALERISERPDLLGWLLSPAWEEFFDHEALSGSHRNADVRNVAWIDPDLSGSIHISALVRDTRRNGNEPTLTLSESQGGWMLESDCTCPTVHECRHAATLVRFLRKRLGGGQDNEAPDDSSDPSTVPGNPGFIAYCIERDDASDAFRFLIRAARTMGRGRVRMLRGVASANPDKPSDIMSEEDIGIIRAFQNRQFERQDFGAMPLEGKGWKEILTSALATGRLFFDGDPEARRKPGGSHRVLAAGETTGVEAYWENLADGGVRPMVRMDRPGLEILPVDPPFYLDPGNALLGELTSTLPPSVLATWSRGPTITAGNIPALIERLSRYPGASLPLPVMVETVVRPAALPTPVLRIRKIAVGPAWERSDRFIGELFFEYGDSPRLAPAPSGGSRRHVVEVDGHRVAWPRDIRAERMAESELLRMPLKRLGGGTNPNALVPDHAGRDHAAAWIELLRGPGIRGLREKGWIIEVDPRAGLSARDASSFVPAIEAAQGIDWFRFDISSEIDGQRLSLIPFIAQAIELDLPPADSPELPEYILLPCENPEDGFIRFPARQLMETVDRVRHLFQGSAKPRELRLDRLSAASLADLLEIDDSDTSRTLARLGRGLRDIRELPAADIPESVHAELREYQKEGFRWLQFLAEQGLHGILADDMGLGKTLQTLTHLAAECGKRPGRPSLIVAPTSVVPNWAAEAAKFVPGLRLLTLHGPGRHEFFDGIPDADLVLTSYPLLGRDVEVLAGHDWHVVVLDEAQHIKNPKSINARSACKLKATQRLCLSGTPMENHLGELWSLMRFLMPGFLGTEKAFNTRFRKPIESDRSSDIQQDLNRRVGPLILRRTKDQVASELPAKTEIIHHVDLNENQTRLYESVRAAVDKRVREAVAGKGFGQSQIVALNALLKLRQICCHPRLLEGSAEHDRSAKLEFLTDELLPTLMEEGRRVLVFSQFTTMLSLIETELVKRKIPFLKLTGRSKNRGELVGRFQDGEAPVFLISLKAGGTGLNLTAADTVIHYDPWWNPAAENQATDRAHRIGQEKPVFVHKLICTGSIEDRILELQARKSELVEALLSEETSGLRLDREALSELLKPLP